MPTKLWGCANRKLSSSHPQLIMGTSRGLAPNPCMEIVGDWDYFPTSCWLVWFLSRVQLFCDPTDWSPPGSSVHGISQARILEWVVIPFYAAAAAAAKSLQSCPTLCDPRQQPTRLHPWDSPGKNTRVGCHFLLQCMKVKSESEVAQSCPNLSNPMD